MFGLGKRSGQYFGIIIRQEPKYAVMAAQSGDVPEKDKAANVIALLAMMCARSFILRTCARMESVAEPMNRDVLAFEAVLFSIYALREWYSPMTHGIEREIDDDYDDPKQQAVGKAFRSGTGLCLKLAEEETGWRDLDSIVTDRMKNYHNAPAISGADSGAERFRSIFLSIGRAQRPKLYYGNASVDLQTTMESKAAIQAFSDTIPQGSAETLRRLCDEYDLIK